MLRTFIQVSSLVVTLEAAIFLAKSGLALSPGAIAELALTKYDYNRDLAVSLSTQRTDTFIGVTLLLVGFALQLINTLWPYRYVDFEVHRGGAISAVIIALIVGLVAYFFAGKWAASTMSLVEQIVKTRLGLP